MRERRAEVVGRTADRRPERTHEGVALVWRPLEPIAQVHEPGCQQRLVVLHYAVGGGADEDLRVAGAGLPTGEAGQALGGRDREEALTRREARALLRAVGNLTRDRIQVADESTKQALRLSGTTRPRT